MRLRTLIISATTLSIASEMAFFLTARVENFYTFRLIFLAMGLLTAVIGLMATAAERHHIGKLSSIARISEILLFMIVALNAFLAYQSIAPSLFN